jgi:hypothetical protein
VLTENLPQATDRYTDGQNGSHVQYFWVHKTALLRTLSLATPTFSHENSANFCLSTRTGEVPITWTRYTYGYSTDGLCRWQQQVSSHRKEPEQAFLNKALPYQTS